MEVPNEPTGARSCHRVGKLVWGLAGLRSDMLVWDLAGLRSGKLVWGLAGLRSDKLVWDLANLQVGVRDCQTDKLVWKRPVWQWHGLLRFGWCEVWPVRGLTSWCTKYSGWFEVWKVGWSDGNLAVLASLAGPAWEKWRFGTYFRYSPYRSLGPNLPVGDPCSCAVPESPRSWGQYTRVPRPLLWTSPRVPPLLGTSPFHDLCPSSGSSDVSTATDRTAKSANRESERFTNKQTTMYINKQTTLSLDYSFRHVFRR